ncbi:hypothetical protein B7486_39715 [cyanobacterium TDX16]|nr:hypothetical protein B7486_39715 [cyanobacterium TDX16]
MYDELKVSNSNTEICYDTTQTALPVSLSLWSPSLETHPQVVEFTYLMGAGIIRGWRALPIAQWSLDDIFTDISPTLTGKLDLSDSSGGSLLLKKLDRPKNSWGSTFGTIEAQFQKLVDRLDKQQLGSNLQKWLKQQAAQLKQWCENYDPPDDTNSTGGFLYCLQQNTACVAEQIQEKLDSQDETKETYFFELLTAGTAKACEQLEMQKKTLLKLVIDYENARQVCSNDEVFAWHSFFTCCDALTDRGLFSRKDPLAVTKAVQGLRKVFGFSISAKFYDIGRFLLKNLVLEIEKRQHETQQADRILIQMQKWFEPEPEQLTPADICLQEDLLSRVDLYDLRLQMEEKVKCNLYDWYKLKVRSADLDGDYPPLIIYLSEQLYELLNPICCHYYYDMQQAKDSRRRQPPKKLSKQVH